MQPAKVTSSSTLETEEDKMKTTLMTLMLSIALLSAGAFAGNSHPKPHHYDAGYSIAYKTQL